MHCITETNILGSKVLINYSMKMLKALDNYFQRKAQKYGYVSLNKNVSHGFNMLVTIIWGDDCLVTARVR